MCAIPITDQSGLMLQSTEHTCDIPINIGPRCLLSVRAYGLCVYGKVFSHVSRCLLCVTTHFVRRKPLAFTVGPKHIAM